MKPVFTSNFLPTTARNYFLLMRHSQTVGRDIEMICLTKLTLLPDGSQDVVLFSQQELQEDVNLNHFSSTSPNSRSLSGRVIIEYTENDMGTGCWVCTKDSGNHRCSHVLKCRNLLQKLVQIDPSATD